MNVLSTSEYFTYAESQERRQTQGNGEHQLNDDLLLTIIRIGRILSRTVFDHCEGLHDC